MTKTKTFDGPAAVAGYWYAQLDNEGRRRYERLVELAGVDVDELEGWSQYVLVWMAGENKLLCDAFIGLLLAARQAAQDPRLVTPAPAELAESVGAA